MLDDDPGRSKVINRGILRELIPEVAEAEYGVDIAHSDWMNILMTFTPIG